VISFIFSGCKNSRESKTLEENDTLKVQHKEIILNSEFKNNNHSKKSEKLKEKTSKTRN